MTTINEALMNVQNELKAPKAQKNNFGKYKYRSCEDILEAVKPILFKNGLVLTITDSIELIGERYYIRAYAEVSNADGTINSVGFAREEESKKGMDASQLTGATSSYARKYALNGLFCIDDTKDSDSTNTHGKDNIKDVEQKQDSLSTSLDEQVKNIASDIYLKAPQEAEDFFRQNMGGWMKIFTKEQRGLILDSMKLVNPNFKP